MLLKIYPAEINYLMQKLLLNWTFQQLFYKINM